ncbi:MAG: hypothetical protein ACLS6O_00025 [Bifidobacterium sp.]
MGGILRAHAHPEGHNEPPVRNIGLSDGSKHEITWGEPTLHDGKVVRGGHRLRRDPGPEMAGHPDRRTRHRPHGPRRPSPRPARAYDQGAGEYTAASLENLADAIEQADELDRTGATDEAMDAMRDRLAEAVGNLDTITWKTDGTTLSHEKARATTARPRTRPTPRPATPWRWPRTTRPWANSIHHHRPRPE